MCARTEGARGARWAGGRVWGGWHRERGAAAQNALQQRSARVTKASAGLGDVKVRPPQRLKPQLGSIENESAEADTHSHSPVFFNAHASGPPLPPDLRRSKPAPSLLTPTRAPPPTRLPLHPARSCAPALRGDGSDSSRRTASPGKRPRIRTPAATPTYREGKVAHRAAAHQPPPPLKDKLDARRQGQGSPLEAIVNEASALETEAHGAGVGLESAQRMQKMHTLRNVGSRGFDSPRV